MAVHDLQDLARWQDSDTPTLFDLAVEALDEGEYGTARLLISLGTLHALSEIEGALVSAFRDGQGTLYVGISEDLTKRGK